MCVCLRKSLEIHLETEVVNWEDGLKLSAAWLSALDLIKPPGSCLKLCEQEEVVN